MNPARAAEAFPQGRNYTRWADTYQETNDETADIRSSNMASMFKRIDYVEITPSDLERTIAFYTDVLGFRVKSRHAVNAGPMREIVYLTLGDTMIELLGMTAPAAGAADEQRVGYRMIALEVEDMDRAIEHLKGKGVAVTWGPVKLPTSIRAEIVDPDGLGIELRQWNAG
jgi:glyoxylase I family protein